MEETESDSKAVVVILVFIIIGAVCLGFVLMRYT